MKISKHPTNIEKTALHKKSFITRRLKFNSIMINNIMIRECRYRFMAMQIYGNHRRTIIQNINKPIDGQLEGPLIPANSGSRRIKIIHESRLYFEIGLDRILAKSLSPERHVQKKSIQRSKNL
jgi:hypothetical protein